MRNAEVPSDAPLVCIRIEKLPRLPVKAKRDHCVLCKAPVWVVASSPRSSAIWCWECALNQIEDDDRVDVAITDEQWKDVKAYRKKHPAWPNPKSIQHDDQEV